VGTKQSRVQPDASDPLRDETGIHVHDVILERAEFPIAEEMSRRDGGRSVLGVRMLSDGESIGAIVLRRTDVQPFSNKQITLLQTFADQAVIANARFLTRENLTNNRKSSRMRWSCQVEAMLAAAGQSARAGVRSLGGTVIGRRLSRNASVVKAPGS
jgi:GAF domain-containing protein